MHADAKKNLAVLSLSLLQPYVQPELTVRVGFRAEAFAGISFFLDCSLEWLRATRAPEHRARRKHAAGAWAGAS